MTDPDGPQETSQPSRRQRRRARAAADLARFLRKYARPAPAQGDPNDRGCDPDLVRQLRRLPPDEFDRLIRDDED